MTAAVAFQQVTKRFDSVVAVDAVDLDIVDGEFFSMLGPSGSGKTTCLRMIAGFEEPTSGVVMLHGLNVTGKPPYQRDVNTVFQDYALFPHMSVADNVAYGLMVKKVAEPERSQRVEEALGLVRLEGFAGRRPAQLSGGQRQRVALARALINRPSVLLLDEPLGALDLKLRQAMQVELKALQREVGITFIFVTHDQEEALTMSDRLAVFNHGRVEQVGTPSDVYENPRNEFVAGFVGVSNIITGDLADRLRGSPAAFTVRPEKIELLAMSATPDPGQVVVEGEVVEATYLGAFTRYRVALPDTVLTVVSQNLEARPHNVAAMVGKTVRLAWEQDSCRPLAGSEEPTPAPAGVYE
ncbi:MAG TPA: ABC transporter ATP-binding protein [Acidimicrobiia bacterium]|nr:ABC transporter ATP-binding protein [Acidimicrobiia bacterium]